MIGWEPLLVPATPRACLCHGLFSSYIGSGIFLPRIGLFLLGSQGQIDRTEVSSALFYSTLLHSLHALFCAGSGSLSGRRSSLFGRRAEHADAQAWPCSSRPYWQIWD